MDEFKELVKFVVDAGTPVVITAGVLHLLYKYLPKYFENRMEVEKTQTKALETLAANSEKGSRLAATNSRQLRTIQTGLRSVSVAAEKLLEHEKRNGRDIPSDVIREIRNIRNVREPEDNNGDG